MANRVLLGKISGSTFGVKVSKKGQNVLTAGNNQLLFDSTLNRTGQIYAGGSGINFDGVSGNPTENAGLNFLTSVTPNKASLGYIPLVVRTEKNMGEREDVTDFDYFIDQISLWETTQSKFIPSEAQANDFAEQAPVSNFTQPAPQPGRSVGGTNINSGEEDAINVTFFVLRIPCAYGFMNSTYFGT